MLPSKITARLTVFISSIMVFAAIQMYILDKWYLAPTRTHNQALPGPVIELKRSHVSSMYDTTFSSRFNLANYPPSCIYSCQDRGMINLGLLPKEKCRKTIKCQYQMGTSKPKKPAKKPSIISMRASCPSPHTIACSLPKPELCESKDISSWSFQVDMTTRIITKQYVSLNFAQGRPFVIYGVFGNIKNNMLTINSNYLPVSYLQGRCNMLYCVYEYKDGKVEEHVFSIGDETFGYCPYPSRNSQIFAAIAQRGSSHQEKEKEKEKEKENKLGSSQPNIEPVTLRLTYDHRVFTHPFQDAIEFPTVSESFPLVTGTLCTMVQNEGRDIRAWMEYHMMMGFERIIIYDNNNVLPDSLMDEILQLKHYQSPRVVRIKWHEKASVANVLNDCLFRFGYATKWMGFIDADEYLVPTANSTDVISILERRYSRTLSIRIPDVLFGPCGASKNTKFSMSQGDEKSVHATNSAFKATNATLDNGNMDDGSADHEENDEHEDQDATEETEDSEQSSKKARLVREYSYDMSLTYSRPTGSLVMEECLNQTRIKGVKAPYKTFFQTSHTAGAYGHSSSHVRLKRDVAAAEEDEYNPPHADKFLQTYHYRYQDWDSFRDKHTSKGDTTGTDRSEAEVRKMWNGARKGLRYLAPDRNNILRFLPELKKRLQD
eukprot:TRINITY_DN10655_c0_g1_i1.p1 TRINITY_DN10655_c0_g1~~TRINITY_DN10655_c0_g1_i1.p1  ORF type:complete len:660 (+),score=108.20 TRINITY_DN10655_c0_g1_i1:332-2311(+)